LEWPCTVINDHDWQLHNCLLCLAPGTKRLPPNPLLMYHSALRISHSVRHSPSGASSWQLKYRGRWRVMNARLPLFPGFCLDTWLLVWNKEIIMNICCTQTFILSNNKQNCCKTCTCTHGKGQNSFSYQKQSTSHAYESSSKTVSIR